MPDPINYTGLQVQIDPTAALTEGIKSGYTINQIQQANDALKLQQQQQQQQRADLTTLLSNPNAGAQDYAAYTLKYPSQEKAVKQAFDLLSGEQQQQRITQGAQIYGALNSGRPDLAESLLDQRLKALQNGGSPADIQTTQALLDVVKTDPNKARTLAGVTLAAWMGPDKFSAAYPAIAKEEREAAAAPGERAKTQAEVANIGSQIETRAATLDIQREDNRIKAMQVALGKEDNALKRQELEGRIADAQQKRDQLARDNQSTADSAFATVDRALDTIKDLEKHPGLSGNLGLTGVIPNVPGSDAANARALIEQLQSQGFLAEVDKMRGLGALTEAEGKKLTNAIGALDTKQDEKQFRKQLANISEQFTAARQRIAQKYGVQAPDRDPVVLTSKRFGPITKTKLEDAARAANMSVDDFRKRLEAAN